MLQLCCIHQASAECETVEGVHFYVNLWAGKTDQKKVVVEVQRSSGCCYLYCQAAKAILRAAKGMTAAAGASTTVSARRSVPPLPKSVLPEQTSQERDECVDEGLEIAMSMLGNAQQRDDCRLMGLESLAQITSQGNKHAAQSILEDGQQGELLREALVSAATSDEDRYARRVALTVLANCLAALDEADEEERPCYDCDEDERLHSVLVDEVLNGSERHPHEACQALRVLTSLLKKKGGPCSEILRTRCSGDSLADVTSRIGLARHVQLYEEAQKLQAYLD